MRLSSCFVALWLILVSHCLIEQCHAHEESPLPIEHHHHHDIPSHDGGGHAHGGDDGSAEGTPCELAAVKPTALLSAQDAAPGEYPLPAAPVVPAAHVRPVHDFRQAGPEAGASLLHRLSVSLSISANAPPLAP